MGKKKMRLIRFDWAMKSILRDKANHAILEGFLSVLLNEKIRIQSILSSQGNKKDEDDKYNDVDILVKNSDGEYIIVEVQNTKQHDYFHRILYGASKVITEYINEGQTYENVKKVISITIAYFDLGQGEDYVYHGTTVFKGLHKGDILKLSNKQKGLYHKYKIHEIYPEYWIIKAGLFDEEQVNNKLDEWIYFFKTGEVLEEFTADGLEEAKEKLDKLKLSRTERREYEAYVERLRKIASTQLTEIEDMKDLIEEKVEKAVKEKIEKAVKEKVDEAVKESREKDLIKTILGFVNIGLVPEKIAEALNIPLESVNQIIRNHSQK